MTMTFNNWTDYDNWLTSPDENGKMHYNLYSITKLSVSEETKEITVEMMDKEEWNSLKKQKSNS